MISLSRLLNLKIARLRAPIRKNSQFKSKLYVLSENLEGKTPLEELIKKYAPKVIYNTIIEKEMVHYDYLQKRRKKAPMTDSWEPLPLTLKYLTEDVPLQNNEPPKPPEKPVNFPYDTGIAVEVSETTPIEEQTEDTPLDAASEACEAVRKRHEMHNWMSCYDNYDDREVPDSQDWKINYGTPDPKSKISKIPCGGCGALLHCKDTAIPGYIPSEIYKNSLAKGGSNLEALICQRCHFLKNYNVALQVQVAPEDYPKVLHTVSLRQGLVILMVDLLDFPCSIWPGIGDIFGSGIPIVVVGNKVDLLPQDSHDFLKSIRKNLLDTVRSQGFASFNIKEVVLISAKTGYGVEELITKLNLLHKMKGDVYIVGCTNVGKSSLFNRFLQSDYCKTQALDLIQRATTSVWPGTTLNLLKFPIKRPVGYRQFLRVKRLEKMQKIESEERRFRKEQLKVTKNPKYATLIGHIDITHNPYTKPKHPPPEDAFNIKEKSNESGVFTMGVDERSREYTDSKWCYDTPGVVQPDQIIHLLTTEELLLTLPKQIILPRTYCLKPKTSLFIAGLARLDYTEGPESMRLTVFASNELPVTICDLQNADELYNELLGTDLLKVPIGGEERISKWPKLEMGKKFDFVGVDWKKSSIDVVLSSAGWVALSGREGSRYHFQAWTPEKRGIYLRDCLLPRAVALTGKRMKNSVAYQKFRFFLE